jgi:hypothetical protein
MSTQKKLALFTGLLGVKPSTALTAAPGEVDWVKVLGFGIVSPSLPF